MAIHTELVCAVYSRKHTIAVQNLGWNCNKFNLCYGTMEEASRRLTHFYSLDLSNESDTARSCYHHAPNLLHV